MAASLTVGFQITSIKCFDLESSILMYILSVSIAFPFKLNHLLKISFLTFHMK